MAAEKRGHILACGEHLQKLPHLALGWQIKAPGRFIKEENSWVTHKRSRYLYTAFHASAVRANQFASKMHVETDTFQAALNFILHIGQSTDSGEISQVLS